MRAERLELGEISVNSRTVLVVDDSATIRTLVNQTLTRLGFSVIEAPDGQAALDKAKSLARLDLVVTDLNMPNLDGIGFVRGLRQLAPFKFVPVLLLTTETRVDQKEKAKSAGATGWLTKPFDPTKLVAVVQKVLP
jgi:two-component system chemotaxis response regulator CheY